MRCVIKGLHCTWSIQLILNLTDTVLVSIPNNKTIGNDNNYLFLLQSDLVNSKSSGLKVLFRIISCFGCIKKQLRVTFLLRTQNVFL